MERGDGTYNVGGALEASMNEAIALLERISGRTLDVRRHDDRGSGRPAAHEGRHDADPQPSSAGSRSVSLEDGRGAPVGLGVG